MSSILLLFNSKYSKQEFDKNFNGVKSFILFNPKSKTFKQELFSKTFNGVMSFILLENKYKYCKQEFFSKNFNGVKFSISF